MLDILSFKKLIKRLFCNKIINIKNKNSTRAICTAKSEKYINAYCFHKPAIFANDFYIKPLCCNSAFVSKSMYGVRRKCFSFKWPHSRTVFNYA